jgi:hypothetical protein
VFALEAVSGSGFLATFALWPFALTLAAGVD